MFRVFFSVLQGVLLTSLLSVRFQVRQVRLPGGAPGRLRLVAEGLLRQVARVHRLHAPGSLGERSRLQFLFS